jgi:hypothetical protein
VTLQDGTITVRFVNTSAYSHSIAGTILEPQKLVMELKLVPYKDGLIARRCPTSRAPRREARATWSE